jgi:hypothetical protein
MLTFLFFSVKNKYIFIEYSEAKMNITAEIADSI